MNNNKNVLVKTLSMATVLGSVVGSINDLIAPMVFLSRYLIFIVASLLLFSIVAFLFKPVEKLVCRIPVSDGLANFFSNYWPGPILLGNIVLFAILTGANIMTQSNVENGGFVATIIPEIYDWKIETGIIKENLEKIVSGVERTAKNSEELSIKADNFKKEISVDPRKEIANLGLSWTDDDFYSVLISSDVSTAKLYFEGGKRLRTDAIDTEENASPIISIFMKSDQRIEEIMNLIFSYQQIDLDAIYQSGTIDSKVLSVIDRDNSKRADEGVKYLQEQMDKIPAEYEKYKKDPNSYLKIPSKFDSKIPDKILISPWIAANWSNNNFAINFLSKFGVNKDVRGKILFYDGTSADIDADRIIYYKE